MDERFHCMYPVDWKIITRRKEIKSSLFVWIMIEIIKALNGAQYQIRENITHEQQHAASVMSVKYPISNNSMCRELILST